MPFGATVLDDDVVNFSVYSKDATSCTLVLFHYGDAEPYAEIIIPEECHVGSVYAIMVFDLDWENLEYGYRFDGPMTSGTATASTRRRSCWTRTPSSSRVGRSGIPGSIRSTRCSSFGAASFATTTSGRATDSSTRPSGTSSSTRCMCATISTTRRVA